MHPTAQALTGLLLVALPACSTVPRGESVTPPARLGPAVARATTSEPGGVRVLFNGPGGRGGGAFLARDPADLGALWSEVGLPGEPAAVDFATHLVLAHSAGGAACPDEIAAAAVDATGTLALETAPLHTMCIALLVTETVVVAVPRRILPARFTWRVSGSRAVAFDRGPSGPSGERVPPPSSLEQGSIAIPLGTVALPPPATATLRSLDDGRQIWVVHRTGGAISVIAGDHAAGRRRGSSSTLRSPVSWSTAFQRFSSGHDSRGRPLHGGPPLESFTFARAGAGRIVVGPAGPVGDGPIEPRSAAPGLHGAARPYAELPPTELAALRPGRFALVSEDLVFGLAGPPRLCELPEETKLRHTYRLVIARAGRYRIAITGDGWRPLLAMPGRFCGYGRRDGRGASIQEADLEPGSYELVVDGDAERAQGPYRLRVDLITE